tara:strand:+ start:1650 stop:2456 length:807 start_codon:yes stop_codon:yes gene_type:complete
MAKQCHVYNNVNTRFKPLLHNINNGCVPLCTTDGNNNEGQNCCNDNSYSSGNYPNCISFDEMSKIAKTDPNNVALDIENAVENAVENAETIVNNYCPSLTEDQQNEATHDNDAAAAAAADANDNMYANMKTLTVVYENLYNNISNHANELSITRRNERGELEKKIDSNKKIINTNKRKVVYEERELSWIDSYKYILLVLFYLLVILYLIFGNFFSSELYKKRILLVVFIIISITPLISKYIIRLLYYIVEYITFFSNNKLPKNVYLNL